MTLIRTSGMLLRGSQDTQDALSKSLRYPICAKGVVTLKHMISNKAICPFYKHEDSQVIYCDGVRDGTVIHLAFANKSDAKDYKNRHCRCDYKGCNIHEMLNKMEEV